LEVEEAEEKQEGGVSGQATSNDLTIDATGEATTSHSVDGRMVPPNDYNALFCKGGWLRRHVSPRLLLLQPQPRLSPSTPPTTTTTTPNTACQAGDLLPSSAPTELKLFG